MDARLKYLELAKIASEKGTLTPTLHRVYKKNYVREVKKEKAATAMAALERRFEN